MSAQDQVEVSFRQDYGKLVALLTRKFGPSSIEDIEDAVQFALQQALKTWPSRGVPQKPIAWLYRVATHKLTETLRRDSNRERILERVGDGTKSAVDPERFLPEEIVDHQLRLLFACCDETLPQQTQLILALKILCGFDVREISIRLFVSEDAVYKRLQRARQHLKTQTLQLDALSRETFAARLPAVQHALYLLFTEGYLSCDADFAIRSELCAEAARLADLLIQHPWSDTPESFALLAMMQLHRARLPARQDASGGLLLLEEQDRDTWDLALIKEGMTHLAASAHGERFSRYHAEAGIAAEHCIAASFSSTRWDRICSLYDLLESAAPSPLHALNRALALAEWKTPRDGIESLEGITPPQAVSESYCWAAVLADLHRRSGNATLAASFRKTALDAAPSPAIRNALRRRLASD